MCLAFYLFIFLDFKSTFGCTGSSLLHAVFLWLGVGTLSSCGTQASHCSGLSLLSLGSRCVGFSSCRRTGLLLWRCGVLLDQGSNPWPQHWQVDSYPLGHHRSPWLCQGEFSCLLSLVLKEIIVAMGDNQILGGG